MLRSRMCTQEQYQGPEYMFWCRQFKERPVYHRKQWEFCFIAQALAERGMLAAGKRGLGFAVGREPLPATFAAYGCEVVATDLGAEDARAKVWAGSHQHLASLETINEFGICEAEGFRRRVSMRRVDMREIPEDLRGFDFCWSACSFEHLGSLPQGLRFVHESLKCVKPGGYCVHTTEFNVSSNRETLATGGTVLYRRQDIERLARELRREGHEIELDWDAGSGPGDIYVDVPPFQGSPHLKLRLASYAATSLGLIIRKARGPEQNGKGSVPRSARIVASLPGREVEENKDEQEKHAVYLGGNRAVTRVLGQLKMIVDARDRTMAPHLLLDGYWEEWVTRQMQELVKPGMTAVDVGANFGYYTLIAAERVGATGVVHAIEPDSRNFELLEENVGLNGFGDRVRLHHLAALDTHKKATLYRQGKYFGDSSLFGGLGEESAEVDATPLDELVEGPVDVMKIDAEGSEPLIFRGMERVLERSPGVKILAEFAPRHLERAGLAPREFLETLRGLGFRRQVVTHKSTLEEWDEEKLLGAGISTLLLERV